MKFVDEFQDLENKVLANVILDKSIAWIPGSQKLTSHDRRLYATGALFVWFFLIELLLLYVTRTPIAPSLRGSFLSALVASLSLYVVSLGYFYVYKQVKKSSPLAHLAQSIDSLLKDWLLEISSLRKQVIISLILTVIAIISVYVIGTIVGVPFGLDIPTYFALALITFCMGQGAYWNAVIPFVTRKLRQLDISDFEIFTLNPSKSPLISSMSRMYSDLVIIDAFVVTLCLAGVFFLYPTFTFGRSFYYIGLVFLGYTLTSYTFLYPQWNLARMIRVAKDATVHQLQQKINNQYNSVLNSEAVDTKHFSHLLELLERIEKTPNTAISLSGLQSFVGSLTLPTVVAIVGSLDWKAIFDRLIF